MIARCFGHVRQGAATSQNLLKFSECFTMVDREWAFWTFSEDIPHLGLVPRSPWTKNTPRQGPKEPAKDPKGQKVTMFPNCASDMPELLWSLKVPLETNFLLIDVVRFIIRTVTKICSLLLMIPSENFIRWQIKFQIDKPSDGALCALRVPQRSLHCLLDLPSFLNLEDARR